MWDLYTRNRELTGEEHIRGNKLPENRYHLVVHVWIVNKEGKYLISQRDASRPTFPLMWECVGGSVLKGETSLRGAVREVKEEVGIDLPPETGVLVCSEIREKFNDFKDVWLFQYDGDVNLANATEKEVADVKWMTPDEIRKYLDEGRLVNTLSYFFKEVINKKLYKE